MKKIDAPACNIEDIYPLSLTYISQRQNKRKVVYMILFNLSTEIFNYGADYEIEASNSTLFNLDKNKFLGQSKELVKLYSNYFSSNKPQHLKIRKYYDSILTQGQNNTVLKCPYCLSSVCTHIDHFLPESLYHGLSVNPKNLVPSCSNCNTEKGTTTFKQVNKENIQLFHPYYDDIADIVWLKANLTIQNKLLAADFFVDKNLNIDPKLLQKIHYTFEELGMEESIGNKASETELINLQNRFKSSVFWKNLEDDEIKVILQNSTKLYEDTHGSNHWLTVLYKELSLRQELYSQLKLL